MLRLLKRLLPISFKKRCKHWLKATAERILQQRGVDIFLDIRRELPDLNIQTVVDVGANVGETANAFFRNCPTADVYCLEPVSDVFAKLEANTSDPRIKCFKLAAGRENSVEVMRRQRLGLYTLKDDFSSALKSSLLVESDTEEVQVITLDSFCEEQRIARIGYLKIDAGGSDLDVLKGAQGLLQANAVDLVEVEAGMNPDSPIFSRFEEMKAFLEHFGYRLFGIYTQVGEWPTREPQMRRGNCVFLSGAVIRGRQAP